MVQNNNEVIFSLSLLDQRLNKLRHISSFISADEYRNIYTLTHNWNSRIPYLKRTIFKPEKIDIDLLEKNKFPIKLFSTVPNHMIYDTVATIPVEFQYISTKNIDIIVLRIDLGDNRYLAHIVELNDNILSTIQILYESILDNNPKMDKMLVFENAYFKYIHKNSIYILSRHKNEYNSWKSFTDELFNKYQVEIKEYSKTGKYMWHRDYILLDNRAMKDYKIYSLKSQWNDNQKQVLEATKTIKKEVSKKHKYFNIDSLFVDKHGNYWSSKEAYLNYCKFIDI